MVAAYSAAIDAISSSLQSNQLNLHFSVERLSQMNQAKQVLLGARGPVHP